VLKIYRKFGAGSTEVLWRDPEEFIEVLESARQPGRAFALITAATSLNVPVMVDAARRILAIECSQFLRGANLETERWLPYRLWATNLGGNSHTVISFNYDRVLEVLKEKLPEEAHLYRVILPLGDVKAEVANARKMGCAPVLKLHGSVDWLAKGAKIELDAGGDLPGRAPAGSDIVLAVPGPDKGDIGSRFKEIGELWGQAEFALVGARRIVFLGYRFPVTDASARVRLLRAVKVGGAPQKIEIVLGPDETHRDVVRMKSLLTFVFRGIKVEIKVLPLFVEDFLPYSHHLV
jgi:hypothetical protein